MPRIRWRPELRWGELTTLPQTTSRLGRGTPPLQEPHPLGASIHAPLALAARRLGRLISSVYPPIFLAMHHWGRGG